MSKPEDGDTKVALLVSLLEPATYPISEYLDALVAANGDVAKAAEALLLPRVKSVGKRKAGTSIDSWLGRKTGKTLLEDAHHSDAPVVVSRLPASPSKAGSPVDLLSLLRQSSPTKPLKTKSLPQPALLLTSQASIESNNIPITLLQSPLSPRLASALYLALMEESEQWERNRWFLAGKWVESPHTSTVYARKGGGYGEPEGEESDIGNGEEKETGNHKSRYYYSGTELGAPKVNRLALFGADVMQDYPILLRHAADLIEPVVNAAIRSRARYPFESAGDWKANVCGANRYDGANSG